MVASLLPLGAIIPWRDKKIAIPIPNSGIPSIVHHQVTLFLASERLPGGDMVFRAHQPSAVKIAKAKTIMAAGK